MDEFKISQEKREILRAPFPDEAIQQHPTKKFLSTIKAIYITERLNDVFGIGGWIVEHEIFSDTEDYVTAKGFISIPSCGIKTPVQYGGHKKTGVNTEPADGYKSAVTDCISKCASYLEIGIDVFKGKKEPSKKFTPRNEKKTTPPVKLTPKISPTEELIKAISETKADKHLDNWLTKHRKEIDALPETEKAKVRKAFREQKDSFKVSTPGVPLEKTTKCPRDNNKEISATKCETCHDKIGCQEEDTTDYKAMAEGIAGNFGVATIKSFKNLLGNSKKNIEVLLEKDAES